MKTKLMFASIPLMIFALLAPAFAQPATETWAMMQGMINSYGGQPVAFGWCSAYAKVGEWAKVHAFWAPTTFQPPSWNSTPSMNVTYSYYAARLVNASLIELNYTPTIDFYISGIWDVDKFTFEYIDGNFTRTMEVILDDASGELSVTGNWTDFTINITGIDLLSGTIMFYYVNSMEPIPIGDVVSRPEEQKHIVNIWDLVHVAKAYGSTPGNPYIPNFDFSMDFNFDFTIDIYDLTTLAANLGEEY